MKTKIAMLCLTMIWAGQAEAQRFTDKIEKELSFEKKGNNALMIFNVNGNVKVIGYNGDKVLVSVDRVITAKTDARLETGKKELQLGVVDRADTLILYVDGICSDFSRRINKRDHEQNSNGWGYQWNNCNDNRNCREGYDHRMNFTIKVPMNVSIYASTINDGDVTMENINGQVLARNVNGGIQLSNISGSTDASTINGSVDLEYAQNPNKDCRYYSLNGDINANFRKGLAANVSFESFNGELYSNVEQLESMPVQLEKKAQGQGVKYKVGGNRYKVGSGGILLDFETFNGNVYLKEKAN